MNATLKFLAFDTSTDTLSIALGDSEHTWTYEGAGGAQASAQLIPHALQLLEQAGWRLAQLDAIVFGRGPGSFTGLRTACAVAQGLAFGANVPVLPVDTLLALAEQARWQQNWPLQRPLGVLALLDARMDEVYSAAYEWQGLQLGWRMVQSLQVGKPETVRAQVSNCSHDTAWLSAGNAFSAYGPRLSLGLPAQTPEVTALPTAQALLRLAPHLFQAGCAVAAEQAMPLYVRDKVAFTTAEREALKTAQGVGHNSAQPSCL